MSVKIRLQRHGKKQRPFYWIVAADARAKRDGKFLEKLGTYNPNTNPATIDLNLDQTVLWLHNGAQPTDTARAILSYKGALLKHHLDGGVRKGALSQEQADAKLEVWIQEKAVKVDAKKDGLSKAQQDAKAKALKAEKVANEKRVNAAAEALKAAEAPEVVEEEVNEVAEEEVVETVVEEVAVAEENIEETPVAEATTEEAPEAKETTPVVEATTEEVPAVEETTPVAEEVSEDSSESDSAEQTEA